MATITPSYTTVNPPYIMPETTPGYQQVLDAFEIVTSGNPQTRLGIGDQCVYMRHLDIRTQTTSNQPGSSSRLPSVALDVKVISTPTYPFRYRDIYDYYDMAAAGSWNLTPSEA